MSRSLQMLPVAEAAATTRTHCPYCALQCGMTIKFDAEAQPATVRADPDFPVNRGLMCIKGFNSGALLDHDERMRTPLLRGANGHLKTASWEAALSFVAERLLAIKAEHGPEALAAFGSGALTNE